MVTEYPDINLQASPLIPQSAINQQALSCIPQSANYSQYTEHARRAGYMGPELGRTQQQFHPYPQPRSRTLSHPLSLSNPYPHPRSFPPPRSHEMHEAIQREIEKQRIREEIIMSEITRRRVLEAEVRREIMMEREMALQRGSNGIPVGSSSVIGFESPPRLPLLGTGAEGRSLEERIILSLTEKESLKNGGFETSSFQRRSTDLRISEVKPVSVAGKEKGKIIFLANPDEDISGSKRKSVTPPAGPDCSEPLSDGRILRKKVKEWSCSVCQVSATSEQALKEHLNGKKHKSKEAALRAQRAGKNYSIGLFPKNATKTIEGPGAGNLGPSESATLLMENLNSDTKKNQSVVVPLLTKHLDSDNSKNSQAVVVPLLTENLDSDNSKKSQSLVVQEAHKKDNSKKNRHRLWCELCQVGSYSQKVMNFHKRGKKHARRLEASQQNASNQNGTIMVVNREGVDEDGRKADAGLEEAGPQDHEPDVADEAKDGDLTVS